jgi:hypothetical protein
VVVVVVVVVVGEELTVARRVTDFPTWFAIP